MIELFSADANLPFTVSILVVVLIALLEGFGALFGLGVSSVLDALLPDIGIDLDQASPSERGLARILGWMRIGEVPALIVLIIFLTTFGLFGISMQSTLQEIFGAMLPGKFAWLPALLASFPVTRVLTGVASRVMPRDDTEAVSRDSLVGSVGVVSTGTAAVGSPAQVRVADRFGQNHYVMVVPQRPQQTFEQGAEVLIVRRDGAQYVVDAAPEARGVQP